MKPIFRHTLIALVAVAAGFAGYLANTGLRTVMSANDAPSGSSETLFAITLPDTEGTEQALAQWRGKVVVVNFWATWCPPCIKEIPEFAAVSRKYADAPVQFVGISIDTLENVKPFGEKFDVPYPLLIGSSQTLGLAAEFGNTARALPFTIILDRQGGVRHVTLGTLNEKQLERKISALLDL